MTRSDKKRFAIGMYGGKFLPFRKGHDYCVRFAARECETVYVLLFWGDADEEAIRIQYPDSWLSVEERTRQPHRMCDANRHIATVVVIISAGREVPFILE